MNLRPQHLPVIAFGGVIGAVAGWLLSLAPAEGPLRAVEGWLGPIGGWVFAGAIGGSAIVVMLLLARAVRDPGAAPSSTFTSVNGIGSRLFGKSEVGPDGSYTTTEWLTVFYVPLVPICRYRLTQLPRRTYKIYEKGPPRVKDVARVYGCVALLGCAGYLLKRMLGA